MAPRSSPREGSRSTLCAALAPRLYELTTRPALRSMVRSWILRSERGGAMSLTIREIFHRFHGVQVGLYSIGPCHVPPGNLPPGTTVGRYCSIYYTVQALDHDRPDAQFLPHGLFDGQALGQSTGIPPAKTALDIGNDVFIGHNAILLPSVQRIGDGAVIGAGSVVHQPVPPYAVVTGNPARVVRYRFSEAKIQELLESQWWLKSLNELRDCIDEFRTPWNRVQSAETPHARRPSSRPPRFRRLPRPSTRMQRHPLPAHGIRSRPFSPIILGLYPRVGVEAVRVRLRSWALRLEGGPAVSLTLREIFRRFHRVTVGLFTATPCTIHPNRYHIGTSFGRYASIAPTLRTFTRNHTTSTKSTSGFFDNPAAGLVTTDLVPWGKLVIGHGVWIGHNAIILPPTETIGEGAVITPGSVVYTNIPPYAIASGFPARVIGYRHPREVIGELLASRWWELSPAELERDADRFRRLTALPPVGSPASS